MEDWYGTGVTEFEEGEVVRGRVVHVGSSEGAPWTWGYKSEGAIPIEESTGTARCRRSVRRSSLPRGQGGF